MLKNIYIVHSAALLVLVHLQTNLNLFCAVFHASVTEHFAVLLMESQTALNLLACFILPMCHNIISLPACAVKAQTAQNLTEYTLSCVCLLFA